PRVAGVVPRARPEPRRPLSADAPHPEVTLAGGDGDDVAMAELADRGGRDGPATRELGPAGQRAAVGAPDVDVPVHRRGDDLEPTVTVEVREHGRREEAGQEAVEAIAGAARREARIGPDRESRTASTIGFPDVELPGDRAGHDLDSAVAGQVGGGDAVAER